MWLSGFKCTGYKLDQCSFSLSLLSSFPIRERRIRRRYRLLFFFFIRTRMNTRSFSCSNMVKEREITYRDTCFSLSLSQSGLRVCSSSSLAKRMSYISSFFFLQAGTEAAAAAEVSKKKFFPLVDDDDDDDHTFFHHLFLAAAAAPSSGYS